MSKFGPESQPGSSNEEEPPKLEIVENIGQRRTSEDVENYKNIREEAEGQREIKKVADDRLSDLKKRQAGGELLSAGETAYLRAVDLSSQKIEESKSEEKSSPLENIVPEVISKNEESFARPEKTQKLEQPTSGSQKPIIEVVSGFDNKRTPEDDVYRQNIVKGVEERTEVREKIQEGEIPSSGELAKLTDSERSPKREFQEGAAKVRTPEEVQIDEENKLTGVVKQIEQARNEGKRDSEVALYSEASGAYEQLTKMKLGITVEARARNEAAKERQKIMTKQEFLAKENEPDRMNKRVSDIRQRANEWLVKNVWSLQQKDAQKYGTKMYESPEQMKVVLENKKSELAKNGILMSDGVLCELLNQGYRIDEIKVKKSWFGFGKAKSIELPTLPLSEGKKETRSIKIKDFMDMVKNTEEQNNRRDKEYAQDEINSKLKYGQKAWKNKKEKCTRDILGETVGQIEESRKPKLEEKQKVVEKPKLEIVTRIGKERTPEQQKEMEKIRKEIIEKMERAKEAKKRIIELIKKQKQGKLLTAKEVGYVNAYADQELRGAA